MMVPMQVDRAVKEMVRRRPIESARFPAIRDPIRQPALSRPTIVPWRTALKVYDPSSCSSPKRRE